MGVSFSADNDVQAKGAGCLHQDLEIGRGLEVEVNVVMQLDAKDAVAASKPASLDRILPTLSRDTLKSICFALSAPTEGRGKQVIIDRIPAESGADRRPAPKGMQGSQASQVDADASLPPPTPAK